jgi:type I restriction enzyme, S subunit
MKKYDSYKFSGIDWIREIPTHWETVKLKYLTESRKELSEDGGEELLSVTESRGIVKRRELKGNDENLSRSENLTGYRLVKQGNLVNNIMLVWKRGLGVSPYDGIVSPAYSVFSFMNNCHPAYFHYLLRSEEYITEFRRNSTGVVMSRLRLYDDSFGSVFSHYPPVNEQQLISHYLDKKTEQIDSLIEKIQKKIELLKEQRTSLINQCVTKGLDPSVEMKDSGVEWIGEIPKHWGVIKIGHYSNIIRGSSPRPAGDPRFFDGSFIPWITVREVTNQETKYIQSTETSLTEEGMKKSTKVYPGTLLFSNSGATLGVPRFTEIEGCINDGSVAFLDIRPSLSPEFLYWFLTTQTTRLRSEQSGFGQPNLNTEIVSNIKVPLPAIDEQNNICRKVEKTSRQIDELIFLSDRKSNVLTEYRQSLISSVVTGKVRVTEDMI